MLLKIGKMLTPLVLVTFPLVCFGATDPAMGGEILSSLTGSGSQDQRKAVSNLVHFIYEAAKEPENVKFENVRTLSGGRLKLGSCYQLANSYRRCSYSVTEWNPHDSNVNYFHTDTLITESDRGVSLHINIDTSTVCLPSAALSKLWKVAPQEVEMPIGDYFGPDPETEDLIKSKAEVYKNINPQKKYVSLKTHSKNDCVSRIMFETH